MVLGVPLVCQFTLERFGSTTRGYWLLRRELLTSDSDNVHIYGTRGAEDLQGQMRIRVLLDRGQILSYRRVRKETPRRGR